MNIILLYAVTMKLINYITGLSHSCHVTLGTYFAGYNLELSILYPMVYFDKYRYTLNNSIRCDKKYHQNTMNYKNMTGITTIPRIKGLKKTDNLMVKTKL